jgi:excisionase family DNA binding protein
MAIQFPDEINPKAIAEERNLKLRFEYSYRAIQYLDYFGVISIIEHTYTPLNLKFRDNKELTAFLYNIGIVYDEITVSASFSHLSESVSVVDTRKILMKDEDLSQIILLHKFYSVNEIAEMLSFSRPTVYKIINEGKLKATRINNQLRIKHSDYVNYVTADA